MKKLRFFDSTLRDGSHAIAHQLKKEWIAGYCKLMDNSGVDTVIVGHGNGLGASSLQVGLSLLSDREMLTAARENLKKTHLGAFLIPGFGTIHDQLIPAIDCGVDLFCVASHCTEADVTKQHISYIREQGKRPYGVLMSYHMTDTKTLLAEALKMQSYGAEGIIIMDSAGASTPPMVQTTIQALTNHLEVDVAFHPHNNMGLAVSNALLAIESGAVIIDGTSKGFGAGAGNCPLEVIAALMQKMGMETGLDLYSLLDAGDFVVKEIIGHEFGISSLSVISGMSGVFSAFVRQVKKASEEFHVDPRDIFIELGRRKVVGGQEDVVVDVAMNLSQMNKKDNISYVLESLL